MSIQHFKDLIVWQQGSKLVILTYDFTKLFPEEEKYVLSSQMRRAAVSINSNIAEGFGRKTNKDKEHFYVMAYGSLTELENQILLSIALGYGSTKKSEEILNQTASVGQLINGLLRAHRKTQ